MKPFFIILCLLLIGGLGFSQNIEDTSNEKNTNSVVGVVPSGILPRGFVGLDLGISSEIVISILKENDMFLYIEKDFGTLSKYDKSILSVQGRGFIDNAYFYFSKEDVLVSVVLFLRSRHIDYVTLYTDFTKKYGRPKMSPDEASWTDTEVSIHLEKPLSIKYVLEKEIPTIKTLNKNSTIDLNIARFLEYF